ncbi:MAG TPA: VWA domain-containing protein, partial [Vicinamibacterales bacterium]
MWHPLRRLFVSAALVAAALVAVQIAAVAREAPAAAQSRTFKASTEAIWMTATVIGPDGHLMTDLTKDDFEVRDDGEVRPITAFRSDRIPFAIVTMFDLSGSMVDNLGALRRGLRELVSHFEPGDRANVGTFDSVPYISSRFSGSPASLANWVTGTIGGGAVLCQGDFLAGENLATRLSVSGFTAIWDAVACGIDRVARDTETPRRVVLVVTDGMDNVSTLSAGQDIERADAAGVMIYVVLMDGEKGADQSIKSLADRTGGGFFVLDNMFDMTQTFGRVAEELRHQYVFGFSPTTSADSKHKIEVKSLKPGSTTRARRVYMTLNPLNAVTVPPPEKPTATPPAPNPAPQSAATVPAARTSPAQGGPAGPAVYLERFEHGDWSLFDQAPPTPEDLRGMLKWFRANAATWTAAEGAANERQRRLVLATFILEMLNTEQDPFLWFGGGRLGDSLQHPLYAVNGTGADKYDEPLPATEMLQWAAAFLKGEPPLPAERWWHLGAIALLEREHATEALTIEADAAHARFPSEDRYVLARAISREELTWP